MRQKSSDSLERLLNLLFQLGFSCSFHRNPICLIFYLFNPILFFSFQSIDATIAASHGESFLKFSFPVSFNQSIITHCCISWIHFGGLPQCQKAKSLPGMNNSQNPKTRGRIKKKPSQAWEDNSVRKGLVLWGPEFNAQNPHQKNPDVVVLSVIPAVGRHRWADASGSLASRSSLSEGCMSVRDPSQKSGWMALK